MNETIEIRGAKQHNLKNIDLVHSERSVWWCSPGYPAAERAALAFDTIYAEGQRRYVESLVLLCAACFWARWKSRMWNTSKGLSPAISIDQKTTSKNPRSTVGTVTEIHDYLRLLYARIGQPTLPEMRQAHQAAKH